MKEARAARGVIGAIALSAVLAAAAPRPAAAQNREHLQMAAELRILQEQNQQLALAVAQLEAALKAITGSIADGGAQTARRFADLEQVLKGVAADLNVMRERTSETNNLIRQMTDEIRALQASLLQLPVLLSTQAPPAGDLGAPGAAAPPAAAPPPAISTLGLSPSRMFETAMGDYGQGQFTLAITGFEQLIKTFPMSERVDDAQYYIGESYFGLARWNDAIEAYDALIRTDPKSEFAPMAMYRSGLAYERLMQYDAARERFERVMRTYPDSSGARLAAQGLQRLPAASAPQRP